MKSVECMANMGDAEYGRHAMRRDEECGMYAQNEG